MTTGQTLIMRYEIMQRDLVISCPYGFYDAQSLKHVFLAEVDRL